MVSNQRAFTVVFAKLLSNNNKLKIEILQPKSDVVITQHWWPEATTYTPIQTTSNDVCNTAFRSRILVRAGLVLFGDAWQVCVLLGKLAHYWWCWWWWDIHAKPSVLFDIPWCGVTELCKYPEKVVVHWWRVHNVLDYVPMAELKSAGAGVWKSHFEIRVTKFSFFLLSQYPYILNLSISP